MASAAAWKEKNTCDGRDGSQEGGEGAGRQPRCAAPAWPGRVSQHQCRAKRDGRELAHEGSGGEGGGLLTKGLNEMKEQRRNTCAAREAGCEWEEGGWRGGGLDRMGPPLSAKGSASLPGGTKACPPGLAAWRQRKATGAARKKQGRREEECRQREGRNRIRNGGKRSRQPCAPGNGAAVASGADESAKPGGAGASNPEFQA